MDAVMAAERMRLKPVSRRLKRLALANKICTASGSDNVSSNLIYLISSSSASLLLSLFLLFLFRMSLINLLFSGFVCASLWQLASRKKGFNSTNCRLCPSYKKHIYFSISISRVLFKSWGFFPVPSCVFLLFFYFLFVFISTLFCFSCSH